MINKKLQEDAGSAVPVNAMGTSSPTQGTGGIDMYSPLLGMTKKKKNLRDIINYQPLKRKIPVA